MYNDINLKEFFTDEERLIIKEAVEDHRASSNHEPRSLYRQPTVYLKCDEFQITY